MAQPAVHPPMNDGDGRSPQNALITRKLGNEIIPRLLQAEALPGWTSYRLYTAYALLGEVFVLLVGLGISHPAFRFLAPSATETASNGSDSIVSGLGEGISLWVAVVALLAWGLLKWYVVENSLAKKCSLIKSNKKHFAKARMDVETALQTPDPIPHLTIIQANINGFVDRLNGEDAWPWNTVSDELLHRAKDEADRLTRQYGHYWTAAPRNVQFQRRSAPAHA